MTIYNFGDVVLVPFPFTDQTSSKKRPAVIINSLSYQRSYSDLIVMAITSQARAMLIGEVAITQWSTSGLLKPSVIKPVFATIEYTLIIRTLGKLEDIDKQALRAALPIILG